MWMTSAADQEHDAIRIGIAMPEVSTGLRGGRPAASPPSADVALAAHGRLDRFCEALGDAIAQPVEAYGIAHYRELLDAMHDGTLDMAWLPPIIALRATARGRTLPIAIPVRGGTSAFSSALFARPDSPLAEPADLVGARAAWVDRHSAAGYLVIRATLRAQGFDLARAFSSETFLGSHEAVAEAVLGGAADVGATFVHFDSARGNALIRAGWGAATPRILAYGGPIPSDVIAASIRVPVTSIRAVQRALCGAASPALQAAAHALLGAEGFLVPSAEHLDPLSRLLEYLDDLQGQPPAARAVRRSP